TLFWDQEQKIKAADNMKWNLVELILKSGAIKDQRGLDFCDAYNIEIEIDYKTNTTSTIKVNGWLLSDINGEL
ncbi:MAG: hypothetical protein RR388_08260, partial [Rikenellaceae bacterium]